MRLAVIGCPYWRRLTRRRRSPRRPPRTQSAPPFEALRRGRFGFPQLSAGMHQGSANPRFSGVGFIWNSLDSLVRNEPFQWVARDPGALPRCGRQGPALIEPKIDRRQTRRRLKKAGHTGNWGSRHREVRSGIGIKLTPPSPFCKELSIQYDFLGKDARTATKIAARALASAPPPFSFIMARHRRWLAAKPGRHDKNLILIPGQARRGACHFRVGFKCFQGDAAPFSIRRFGVTTSASDLRPAPTVDRRPTCRRLKKVGRTGN